MNAETRARVLARRFVEEIREWLTEEEMEEVVRRNRERGGDGCSTHDFCDANMAMADAFEDLGWPTPFDEADDEEGPEWNTAVDLWNRAWDIAHAAEFDLTRIPTEG